MRDYTTMRAVLTRASSTDGRLSLAQLANGYPMDDVLAESLRLMDDKLVVGEVRRDAIGQIRAFSLSGLTDDGKAFYSLIENDEVWEIVRTTLDAAGVDVSYPLLKEVCEEIVKRYVVSFIPDMRDRH